MQQQQQTKQPVKARAFVRSKPIHKLSYPQADLCFEVASGGEPLSPTPENAELLKAFEALTAWAQEQPPR
eukprot:5556591-Alexandrium_andersonii.AAC.1